MGFFARIFAFLVFHEIVAGTMYLIERRKLNYVAAGILLIGLALVFTFVEEQ